MKKEGFYNTPYESEYWMTFAPCRKAENCPQLKSNDVMTANNRTWYYVAHPRFDVTGYISTENALKWRCGSEEELLVKGDYFTTWKIAVVSSISFLILVLLISALVLIRRRKRGLKLTIHDEEHYEDKHFKEEHDVFVSYCREDWDWVRKTLFEKLRHEGYSSVTRDLKGEKKKKTMKTDRHAVA
ncbi:hypothetical protein KUTeg_015721 [Tegillarca granosa]|uniref:Uncharacterized protein n=1 Tax=Tegillarca granosa TaxID=220873 RepID=A0ABQ9ENE1_TEGGR|nr:hypothetical protein KUTeg_015721 [Tegillarca granosa]